jgi:hypothetical protein
MARIMSLKIVKPFQWAIIDGQDVCYKTAKKVRAIHPTPIPPVTITRVTAIEYEGELRLIIDVDRRVKIEKCVDRGCIHLVEAK